MKAVEILSPGNLHKVGIKKSSWEKMRIFKEKWKASKMKYAFSIKYTFLT